MVERRPRAPAWGVPATKPTPAIGYNDPDWNAEVLQGGASFGPMDRTFSIVTFQDEERKNVASLFHVACHAVLDQRNALFSALALTPTSAGGDGEWTCAEILRARVPADLVVLSGCETARGRTWQGESAAGLTRAFLLAGASAVLASLWDVDDAATTALMTAFYSAWRPRDGSPPLSAAEALRRAEESVRADPRWSHPRFWAGWLLTGEPE